MNAVTKVGAPDRLWKCAGRVPHVLSYANYLKPRCKEVVRLLVN